MKDQFFFIGTEAELIKVFPIIIECQNRGNICHIIASGQNDLKKSRIMDYINLNGKYIELSDESSIRKSAIGLLGWFIKTRHNAISIIEKNFEYSMLANQTLVVHGDTVSTMLGAMIGRKLNMKVCHVEAGLRSHNLFNPFPEEIDRLITSKMTDIHFAPGEEAANNLKKEKGRVVNTIYNTILDSLIVSEELPIITRDLENIIKQDYFVFVMHRQENLMNKDFVRQVIQKIELLANEKECVFILHEITKNTLQEMGILDELKKNTNIVLLPRVDYFDFMKLLKSSKFVITDGGSNQEELHYMGKPCLIMRKTTERQEGIGTNALLYGGNLDAIKKFASNYRQYERNSLIGEYSPSEIICNNI